MDWERSRANAVPYWGVWVLQGFLNMTAQAGRGLKKQLADRGRRFKARMGADRHAGMAGGPRRVFSTTRKPS